MTNRTKRIYKKALDGVAKMQKCCDALAAEALKYVPVDEFGNHEYDISCAFYLGDGLCFNNEIEAIVVPVETFFNVAENGIVDYEQFKLLAI